MTKRMLVVVAAAVLLCCSAAAAEETYYVQSVKARVLWEPSFRSPVMREVPRGEALRVTARDGMWLKVKLDFETGYVPALVMSKHPPLKRFSLIKADEHEIRQSVRRRASTYSSAAAARGLAQEGRMRLSKEERADYYSLEKMEAATVTKDEVARFLQGGSL